MTSEAERGVVTGRLALRRPRLRYALALAVLAPFLAETVASSNTPAVLFPVLLPMLVLVYGLPALLVRELWVRRRIGWPGLLVLGVAYTMFNEGLVAATWFKLAPDTGKVLVFTASQALHAAGVNWAVAAGLVVFHTFFSILLPWVLAEALAAPARGRPWLGRLGLVICTAAVLLVMVGSLSAKATARVCSGPAVHTCVPGRLLSFLAILVLVAVALLLPRRRLRRRQSGHRPRDAVLVLAGFGFSVVFLMSFFVLPLTGHPAQAVGMAGLLLLGATAVLLRWSQAPDWDLRAAVLLGFGALLPGMITSLKGLGAGQPVAALLAVLLLRHLARRATVRS